MRLAAARETRRTGPSTAIFMTGSSPTPAMSSLRSVRVEEIGGLWDRIREAQRETEELNLDRKLHILALFAEIAATAPRG